MLGARPLLTATTRLHVRYSPRGADPLLQIPRLIVTQSIHRQMSTVTKAPFIFYTEGTPNGRKVAVYLEELKSIYGDKVAYE